MIHLIVLVAFCHQTIHNNVVPVRTIGKFLHRDQVLMQENEDQRTFAGELEKILTKTDTSVRRLERLCGISRRTLENWLYGHSQRPRHVEPILKRASALHLPAVDTNRLLLAAGYPLSAN
jgi:hypothetical protein